MEKLNPKLALAAALTALLASAPVLAHDRGWHEEGDWDYARVSSSTPVYREGRYSGAPLGHAIEEIAARAKCDVLIGVPGQHGTLLTEAVSDTAPSSRA